MLLKKLKQTAVRDLATQKSLVKYLRAYQLGPQVSNKTTFKSTVRSLVWTIRVLRTRRTSFAVSAGKLDRLVFIVANQYEVGGDADAVVS